MASRVPATLATCPCHSPETLSRPCSPVSVPVQAPPPWEGWLHACIPSGSEDPYWAAPVSLGPRDPPPPVISSLSPQPPLQSWLPSQGCLLLGVEQVPALSAPALKWWPVVRPSPPPPWDALKGSPSTTDTASLFISNPFFQVWKLLTSLPGQENPHSGGTTPRSFQTPSWMADLELKSQTLCQFTL